MPDSEAVRERPSGDGGTDLARNASRSIPPPDTRRTRCRPSGGPHRRSRPSRHTRHTRHTRHPVLLPHLSRVLQDRAQVCRRCRVPPSRRRAGPGPPVAVVVPPPSSGRPRGPVHSVPVPRSQARRGQDGPRRPGRHQAGGERFQAQGHGLRPHSRQGGRSRSKLRSPSWRPRLPLCRPTPRPPTPPKAKGWVGGKEVDLPAELDRREKRLARPQAARTRLEARAAAEARDDSLFPKYKGGRPRTFTLPRSPYSVTKLWTVSPPPEGSPRAGGPGESGRAVGAPAYRLDRPPSASPGTSARSRR